MFIVTLSCGKYILKQNVNGQYYHPLKSGLHSCLMFNRDWRQILRCKRPGDPPLSSTFLLPPVRIRTMMPGRTEFVIVRTKQQLFVIITETK